MLTPTDAIELAGRRQRRALREAAGFASLLGEPVGFLRRHVPGGIAFEAVALESARTCALVDEHGALRLAPPAVVREASARHEPHEPAAAVAVARRFPASRRTAEQALVASARPAAE